MADLVVNDFSYLREFSNFTSREDFWMEVIAQLNKDLNKEFAINVPHSNLTGEFAADALVNALQKYLPSVTPELSEILYRIDMPENKVNSLKDLPIDIYYRCLSEMIVKRIIMKVVFRKNYSDKKRIE